jgi:hypothetical protein
MASDLDEFLGRIKAFLQFSQGLCLFNSYIKKVNPVLN